MAEMGIALGLAAVLGPLFIAVVPLRMAQGGSVSLEMLPILVIALRRGLVPGVALGLVFGLLQLVLPGAFLVQPLQVALDYPIAFAVLGLAALIPVPIVAPRAAFIPAHRTLDKGFWLSVARAAAATVAIAGSVEFLFLGLFRYNAVADAFGAGAASPTTGERIACIVIGVCGVVTVLRPPGRFAFRLGAALFIAAAARYGVHVVSGVVFFSEYAPEGQPVLEYSAIYNAWFMIPATIATFVAALYVVPSLDASVWSVSRAEE